ncbi:alpha-1,6-glucosidase domain-containing protein [Cognatilysobacter tabacisoli]|uniref:alpha-1,6-glucosidase domain-containing protein n=1 Tax=Cognatilysobacter tabacisoli TaxID=2315424 RepID=UPI0018C89031|nr:alpha-1,6-glucosidase domain-containing protein [Lysobacter tabacisoli]
MSLSIVRSVRVARMALLLVLSLLLSACELPWSPAAEAGKAPLANAHQGQGNVLPVDAAALCDAPPSTVLAAIPAGAVDGAPADVRIRYHRPDGNYADWGLHVWQVNDAGQYVADYPGVTWPSPLARSGIDDFGAYFDLEAAKFTHPQAAGFGFIVHPPGQNGDPGVDRIVRFGEGTQFWLRSGDATVYRSNPLGAAADIDTVRVHYKRFDGNYDAWGLHLWPTSGIDVSRLPGLALDQWPNPVPLSAMPNYAASPDGSEVVFDLPVLNPQSNPDRSAVEFIIHGMPSNPNGGVNNKDGWNDNIRVAYASLTIRDGTGSIWLVQGEPRVFTASPDTRRASTTDARAVWLTRALLQWPRTDTAGTFRLYHSATGQIVARKGAPVAGADGSIALAVGGAVPAAAAERFKWVEPGVVLAVDAADDVRLASVLPHQLVVVQQDVDGNVLGATTAQLPGQLDDRHASADALDDLGVRMERGQARFRLWAPTAQQVTLCVYAPGGGTMLQQAMDFDPATGSWALARRGLPTGLYYRYAVQVFVRGVGLVRNLVTDPYAISLDADSQRSYLADLDAPQLQPPGWQLDRSPARVREQEDMAIYELHVRDFSIDDATVDPRHRGKYLAFANWNSNGMKHLRALAQAGLTDVHLLPVFDLASVPETGCVTPQIPMAAPDSDAQQAAVGAVRDADCFNWGYDPWHFTAPEGSFATDARDGAARVREFRAMVMALHAAGLRVGMDVVYNHTSASGQNARSVLDRVVPGYYHRLNGNGDIERSTCCENTATENLMMGKLMIDSVKTWAVEHHVDSFRFDLMGHQPRAVMERLYDEVSAAAGRPIQLLGEGWNFGEVANGARFVQASQLSLNGSGIGTFSDRARDAVRGGSGFDSGDALVRNQGYINGLVYDDNGSGANKSRGELMWFADLVKVGLAGSLRDYVLTTHWDATLPLAQLDYNGQPAGYVSDPQEAVNYVENHDNQTLFDNNAYKLPLWTTREDRARVQLLGAAITAFSQGVAYYHAGIDTLRSKSMDRNSYNSGDWFNRLDWTYTTNHFGTGLPPAGDNAANWPVMAPRLANPDLKPMAADIAWTRDAFRDLLRIRASSTLFRLRTADEVRQRLTFLNTGSAQVPTVLAARLDGRGLDGANFRELLYLVNVDTRAQTLEFGSEAGKAWRLHPVHAAANAADRRAANATVAVDSGTFSVPARTAVVFVVP